jgi:Xaa-Pro dipeptidase
MPHTAAPVSIEKSTDRHHLPTYSLAERDRRWKLARDFMDREGLRALIVYGDREGAAPAPFAPDTYFTNDRPGAVVVFPRDAEPVSLVSFPMAVTDHMEAQARHEQVWIRSENVFAGKMGRTLVEALTRLGLARASVGVIGLEPYPPYYFDGAIPYNTWKEVLDRLPGAVMKPVQQAFLRLTAPRSAEELKILRWSAWVGEQMCEAMREVCRPGVTEADVYAAIMEAAPKHACFTAMVLLGSGKEHATWGPPTWTYRPHSPRVIEDGDVVLAEISTSFGMLETQHQPTVAVGEVHPDFEKAAKIARKSYEIGLDHLRPGRRFKEVVEAMEEPVRKAGGWHVHPWIHGMNPFGTISGLKGLDQLPGAKRYGRVGEIPLTGGDTELIPGMTFALEPNCAFDRRMVNLGGTVVVGEDTPLELNRIATRMMRA